MDNSQKVLLAELRSGFDRFSLNAMINVCLKVCKGIALIGFIIRGSF